MIINQPKVAPKYLSWRAYEVMMMTQAPLSATLSSNNKPAAAEK